MWMENSVDPDQLSSSEASLSGSTWFSKEGIIEFEKAMHTVKLKV